MSNKRLLISIRECAGWFGTQMNLLRLIGKPSDRINLAERYRSCNLFQSRPDRVCAFKCGLIVLTSSYVKQESAESSAPFSPRYTLALNAIEGCFDLGRVWV